MKHSNLFVYNNYNNFANDSQNYIKGNDIIAQVIDIFETIYWLRLEIVWRQLNPIFTRIGTDITSDGFPKGKVVLNSSNNNSTYSVPLTPDADRLTDISNFATNFPNIKNVYLNNAVNITNASYAFEGSNVENVYIGSKILRYMEFMFNGVINPNCKCSIHMDVDYNTININNLVYDSVFDTIEIIDDRNGINSYTTQLTIGQTDTSSGNKLRIDNGTIICGQANPNYGCQVKEVIGKIIHFDFTAITNKLECDELYLIPRATIAYTNGNHIFDQQDNKEVYVKCNKLHIHYGLFNNFVFDKTNPIYIYDDYTDINETFLLYRTQYNFNYDIPKISYNYDDTCLTKHSLKSNINLNTDNVVIQSTCGYILNSFFIANEVNDELINKIGAKVLYCYKDNTYQEYADINLVDTEIDVLHIGPININKIHIEKLHALMRWNDGLTYNKTILEINGIDCYISGTFYTNTFDKTNSVFSGSFINYRNDVSMPIDFWFKNAVIKTDKALYRGTGSEVLNTNNVNIIPNIKEYITIGPTAPMPSGNSYFTLNISIFKDSNNNVRICHNSNVARMIFNKDVDCNIYLYKDGNNNCFMFPFINCSSENNKLTLMGNVDLNQTGNRTYTDDYDELNHTIYINDNENYGINLYMCQYCFGITTIIGNINYILNNHNSLYEIHNLDNPLTNITSSKTILNGNNVSLYNYSNLTSDSINSLISKIEVENTETVRVIHLKRALYNKINPDVVNGAIAKNIEFNIHEN